MPLSDPIKRAEYNKNYLRKHYQDNKQYYFDKKLRRKKEAEAYVNELKEGKPCKDCGNSYPVYAMDFDHREGEKKERGISLMVRRGVSIKKILLEIKKCDLVCAVCHRIRTHKRYGIV